MAESAGELILQWPDAPPPVPRSAARSDDRTWHLGKLPYNLTYTVRVGEVFAYAPGLLDAPPERLIVAAWDSPPSVPQVSPRLPRVPTLAESEVRRVRGAVGNSAADRRPECPTGQARIRPLPGALSSPMTTPRRPQQPVRYIVILYRTSEEV